MRVGQAKGQTVPIRIPDALRARLIPEVLEHPEVPSTQLPDSGAQKPLSLTEPSPALSHPHPSPSPSNGRTWPAGAAARAVIR